MNKKLGSLAASTLVILVVISLAFNTQRAIANGVITIREDGSIDPPTAPIQSIDNIIYTFTDNINDSIIIERSNITIDGAGYMLNGPGSIPSYAGIHIEGYSAINVTVRNITITDFTFGIGLISTNLNKIIECVIVNNTCGIWAAESMNNTFLRNTVLSNTQGIYFNTVIHTEIYENNITNNDNGVWLEFAINNKFYGNYFIDNTNHTYIEAGSINLWNDTYPIGGNYWSDFEERYPGILDNYSGEYPQSEPGSDDFWDNKYEIDQANIDYYPIVPEIPALILMPLFMIGTLLSIAAYRKKIC